MNNLCNVFTDELIERVAANVTGDVVIALDAAGLIDFGSKDRDPVIHAVRGAVRSNLNDERVPVSER